MTEEEIFMEILNKGEYQVSDLERETNLENIKNEVAQIIASMCVNRDNLAPVPVAMVMKGMN